MQQKSVQISVNDIYELRDALDSTKRTGGTIFLNKGIYNMGELRRLQEKRKRIIKISHKKKQSQRKKR